MHSGYLFLGQKYSFLQRQKTSEPLVPTLHWLILHIKQHWTSEICRLPHGFCQAEGLEAAAAAVGNLMWGSYQSSHNIISSLPLAPLTGFPSFSAASLCKAGLDALHKLQRNQWVTWSLRSPFDTFQMIARAILCNTWSNNSVWWELQNLASSSTFKMLKILSEVKEYWGWRRKEFNFSTFYLWHLLGFWVFWFKMSPWLPVITML